MWRSLVARFAGGEEVAGSNPVIPTIALTLKKTLLTLAGPLGMENRGSAMFLAAGKGLGADSGKTGGDVPIRALFRGL